MNRSAASLPADGLIAGVGFSAGAECSCVWPSPSQSVSSGSSSSGWETMSSKSGDPTAIVAALESSEEPEDVQARLFRRLAQSAGNDPRALSAFLRRPRRPVAQEELSRVECPVLVVLGNRDTVRSANRLVAALPSDSLVTLEGVDHFATPSDFGAIDATVNSSWLE